MFSNAQDKPTTQTLNFLGKARVFTEEEKQHREHALKRYKEKRKRRDEAKPTRYPSRQLAAAKRPRDNGRFLKKQKTSHPQESVVDTQDKTVGIYSFDSWSEIEEQAKQSRANQSENSKRHITESMKNAFFPNESSMWIPLIENENQKYLFVQFEEVRTSQYFLFFHSDAKGQLPFLEIGTNKHQTVYCKCVAYNQDIDQDKRKQLLQGLTTDDIDKLINKFKSIFFPRRIVAKKNEAPKSVSSPLSSSSSSSSTALSLSRLSSSAHRSSRLHKVDNKKIEYIEFQTIALELSSSQTTNPEDNRISKIKHALFSTENNKWIRWYNNKNILVRLSEEKKSLSVFHNENETVPFLQIIAEIKGEEKQLRIEKNTGGDSTKGWSEIEISDLAKNLSQLFCNRTIKTENANITKDEFTKKIDGSLLQPAFTRLTHILYHGSPLISNQHAFTINWPGENNQYTNRSLTFHFNYAKIFDSYFMSENALLHKHYGSTTIQPGASPYYSLKVFENPTTEQNGNVGNEQHPAAPCHIITIMMTLDLLVGELHEIKKGMTLTGTQVLNLALYLIDGLFQLKSVYLNDAATVSVPGENNLIGYIPLRVSFALGGKKPKTWYGRYGFEPVACNNVETGWNLQGKNPRVSQDPNEYYTAVTQLRDLKLSHLFHFLPPERQSLLEKLFNKYKEHFATESITQSEEKKQQEDHVIQSGRLTLHDLTAVVYGISKNINANAQDIEDFNNLLKLNQYYNERSAFDKNQRFVTDKIQTRRVKYKNSDGVISEIAPTRIKQKNNTQTEAISQLDQLDRTVRTMYFTRFFVRSKEITPFFATNNHHESAQQAAEQAMPDSNPIKNSHN